MKQAVILAGGKGTRLQERLNGLPKPLIDVCGKPLLERQLRLLRRYGFSDVWILVSHRAQTIVEFCASRDDWGLRLQCLDDGEPRGTAGATLAVLDRLQEEFLVMYGDTMLEVNLSRFHETLSGRPDAAATLFLHPNDHPYDSDLVQVDDHGTIEAFHPYPHAPDSYYQNLVNAALYWVRKSALLPFREKAGQVDFGKHLFPEMLARGQNLVGYISPEYIKDIGTPERLDRVCKDFMSGRIERSNLDRQQVAVFLDRDGTLNEEVGHLARADDLKIFPKIPQAIRRLNQSDYKSIVVTNQPVLARGDCSPDELRRVHARMETILGKEGAYLDRVYFCPHHPDSGFAGEVAALKIPCDCRKPKTGLIEAACRDFNIDKTRSWLVGDSLVDMATARAAGLRAVLVETGYAGMDYRERVWPDYTFPDLSHAVDFILGGYAQLFGLATSLTPGVCPGDLVLVGGLSRSGKSNFASVLADSLRARGLVAHRLPLDAWLIDASEREAGIMGRYDLSAVVQLLKSRVSQTQEFHVSVYHKLQRRRLSGGPHIRVGPQDVIVVDGTVALELAQELPGAHRFFIEIEEDERRRRVVNEYRLRGYDDLKAEAIYDSRQRDEVPRILAGTGDAQRLNLRSLVGWAASD